MPLANDASVSVLLLDIEGTTTPVSFVYDALFPYARRHFEEFLRNHTFDPEIREQLKALRRQWSEDAKRGLRPPHADSVSRDPEIAALAEYGHWLMDRDSKNPTLKFLQGKIWLQGYESGELHGEVFPDVPPAFERWSRREKAICIYSSGSVLAQELLFRTTSDGDLTAFLSNFFDTKMGPKGDAESYRSISESLGRLSNEFLFISDSAAEVDAAQNAGMRTALCVRDPGIAVPGGNHPVIRTFDEVFPA